jgi:hypothetical protein
LTEEAYDVDDEDWADMQYDETGEWEDWPDDGYEDEENDEVYYTHNPEEPEVGDKFFTEAEQNYEDA